MEKDTCNICGGKYVLKDGHLVCETCGHLSPEESETIEGSDFINTTDEEKIEESSDEMKDEMNFKQDNDTLEDNFNSENVQSKGELNNSFNEESLKELGVKYQTNFDPNFEQKIKVAYSLLTNGLFKDAENVFGSLSSNNQNPRILLGKVLANNNLTSVGELIENDDLLNSNLDLLINFIDYSSKDDATKYLKKLVDKIITYIDDKEFEKAYEIYSRISNYNCETIQEKHGEIANIAVEKLHYPEYFYKIFDLALKYIVKDKEKYLKLIFDSIINFVEFEELGDEELPKTRGYYYNATKTFPDDFDLKLLEFCILSKKTNCIEAIGDYLNAENIKVKLKEKIDSFEGENKNRFLNILSNVVKNSFYDEKYIENFKPLEDSIKLILTYDFEEKEELINFLLKEFYSNPSKSYNSLFELIIFSKYPKDSKELIDAYIKYSNAFLRFEVFDNAEKYAKTALSLDENNSEALTILFLISMKASNIKNISKNIVNLDNFEAFEKILKSFDDENKKTGFIYNMCSSCIEYMNDSSNYEPEFNKRLFNVFDYIIKNYPETSSKELLNSLNNIADLCLEHSFFEEAEKYYSMMLEKDQNNCYANWGLLKARLKAKDDEELIHQPILIGERPEYINALLSTGNDQEAYNRIIELKEEQESYLTNKEIQEKKQEETEKKNKKKKKIIIISSIVAASLAVIISVTSALTVNVFIPMNIYNESLSLINDGKYEEGYDKLETISKDGYKDKEAQKNICKAGVAFNKGDFESGIKYFTEAGGKVNVNYDTNGGKANKNSETISNSNKNYFINDSNTSSHSDTNIDSKESINSFINNDPSKDGYTFQKWVIKDFDIKTAFQDYKCELSLKATYATITYNISYELNGGTCEGLESIYNVESSPIKLKEPSKTGYTFIGWSGTGIDSIQKEVTIPTGSIGDRNYIANYKANEYKVTLDWNDNTHVEDVTVTYDSKYSLKTPTKTGYTFKFWAYLGSKFEQTGTWNLTKDITLKAVYEAIEYKITYTLNGGSHNNPTSYTIETSSFSLSDPTRTGYTFTGWTGTGISSITKSVTIPKGSIGNRSYTANYKANDYTITLDWGDNKTSKTKDVTYGSSYTLEKPSRTGYTFKYWAYNGTKVDLSGTWKIAGNVTLNAVYGAEEYSISYNLNGGSCSSNPSYYTIESTTFTLVAPTKTGYTFTGWSGTGIVGISKTVTIYKGSTGDRSYTANYKANEYTVTLDWRDGKNTIKKTTVTYGSRYVLSTPQKDGYTFKTWLYNYEDFSQIGIWNIASNVTLTASYDLTFFTIDYDLNSGSLPSGQSNYPSYTIESASFTLKEPSKTGYTFIGWTGTDVEEPTKNLVIKKGSFGNKYFKANYQSKAYLYENSSGSNYTKAIDVKYNDEYTLYTPTKTGYQFVRWYYIKNSNKVTIPNTGTWLLDGNLKVYAEWTEEYSINCNLNGGSFEEEIDNPIRYTALTETFSLQNPIKTGYTFTGWTGTNLSGVTKTVTIPKGSSGNRIYAANYSANQYTVTLIDQVNKTTEQITVTYDSQYELPTLNDASFAGWVLESDNKTKVETTGIWKIASDVTLVASHEVKIEINY